MHENFRLHLHSVIIRLYDRSWDDRASTLNYSREKSEFCDPNIYLELVITRQLHRKRFASMYKRFNTEIFNPAQEKVPSPRCQMPSTVANLSLYITEPPQTYSIQFKVQSPLALSSSMHQPQVNIDSPSMPSRPASELHYKPLHLHVNKRQVPLSVR